MNTHRVKFLCCLLSFLFLLNGLVIPAQAQRRAIVVNAEQPNVWTLEQAHYLLAQMHRRNLDLRANEVGTLDANEINGLNFEVLRTLVEFGAVYDDAARFNNSLLRPQKRADAERALRLQRRRDELAEDSFRLNREIARLGRERALATTEEERANLDAQIAELTSLRDANEKSIERLDKDIAAANGPSGDVQSTAPPEPTGANRLPTSSFDESFKEVTKTLINRFNEAPKLNASLRLDNFLQLQYEIIAKQLTLLRDEVGPGERIIFLEMPQSVNATHDKADKKWAQSWWKVAGYTTPRDKKKVDDTKRRSIQRQNADQYRSEDEGSAPEETSSPFFYVHDFKNSSALAAMLKEPKESSSTHIASKFSQQTRDLLQAHKIGRTPSESLMKRLAAEFNSLLLDPSLFEQLRSKGFQLTNETRDLANRSPQGEDLVKLNRKLLEQIYRNQIRMTSDPEEVVTTRKIIQEAIKEVNVKGASERVEWIPLDEDDPSLDKRTGDKKSLNNNEIRIEDRSVRTIDLIPRQGSVNVNDIKLRVRSGVLTAIARTLFGFGASLNVQRQRETFSQFVQQELYSSSFGKGAREFGWTFSPMPGTDRVLSGIKTTYAVMVVPKEAEALVMYANGCVFPRAEYQPLDFQDTLNSRWDLDNTSRNCGGRKAFVVPIPGGGNEDNYEFQVDGLDYVPADKADRVTLLIYGRNFPAQIGLLVDGIPLTQSIGVAQPLIRDDSQAFAQASAELQDGRVLGRFERIDANQIVAVFERPGGKDGVQPVLTMTAPGKVKILNTQRLNINGTLNAVLNATSTPLLFGKRPADKDAFRIDKVDIYKDSNPHLLLTAVSGAGFRDASGTSTLVKVLLNGQEISPLNYWVDSPTLLRVRIPIPGDDTIKVSLLSAFTTIESNPVANPAKLRVSNVSVISYEPDSDYAPGTIVVKLEGSGFSDEVMAYLNEVTAANALKLAVKSSTEAILKIDNPDAAVIVVLEDSRTGQRTKTIITRKGP